MHLHAHIYAHVSASRTKERADYMWIDIGDYSSRHGWHKGAEQKVWAETTCTTYAQHVLYLLNIWEFVYFVWGLSPPKRRVVRWRNLACRRVPTTCRTSAGFYVCRGRRYENNDIFPKKCVQIGPDFCCGATAGSRPIPAAWLAGCSSALARYRT